MPKKLLTLKERLTKYKVTQERYDEEQKALTKLGYLPEQIDKLILREYSAVTIKTLLKLHDELIKHFSQAQIVSMAMHQGGSKNLETATEDYQALKDLGFSTEQIVKMVSQNGGSKNLKAQIKSVNKEINISLHSKSPIDVGTIQNPSPSLLANSEKKRTAAEFLYNPAKKKKVEEQPSIIKPKVLLATTNPLFMQGILQSLQVDNEVRDSEKKRKELESLDNAAKKRKIN